MLKFQYQNRKIFSGLQNRAIRGLQIGAGFRDYKLGQEGIQIRVALGISNCCEKNKNWGRDFKSGQRDFKPGQRSQIGLAITNQCRTIALSQNTIILKGFFHPR